MNALAQAVETSGGITAAALALEISPQRLTNWVARGVPVEMCAKVERKLSVSRQCLRPDDWQVIWPELAKKRRTTAGGA